jgi:hypothetical protein
MRYLPHLSDFEQTDLHAKYELLIKSSAETDFADRNKAAGETDNSNTRAYGKMPIGLDVACLSDVTYLVK